jgi:hypothetical protein
MYQAISTQQAKNVIGGFCVGQCKDKKGHAQRPGECGSGSNK